MQFFNTASFFRQRRYKRYLRKRYRADTVTLVRRGIPEQYGIFYAMGGALSMEGILSACYHICPTKVNFQFDTTFMYVISVLVFLKVYQVGEERMTTELWVCFYATCGTVRERIARNKLAPICRAVLDTKALYLIGKTFSALACYPAMLFRDLGYQLIKFGLFTSCQF